MNVGKALLNLGCLSSNGFWCIEYIDILSLIYYGSKEGLRAWEKQHVQGFKQLEYSL